MATTSRTRAARRATGLMAFVAAMLAALAVLLGGAPAYAADEPLDPGETSESILIWVRLDSDKSNLPGIAVAVQGEGYDVVAVTGDDGKVEIGVPGPGDYTLAIDQASIPAGLGTPNIPERVVAVDRGQVDRAANFLVGDFEAGTGTDGGGTDAGTGGTETATPGATTPPTGTTAGFWDLLLPKLATGLVFGLLIALASIGASLIYGTTGLNNFAHGELVTFGALMAYTFTRVVGLDFWAGLAVVLLMGGLMGFAQDFLIWKPLRRLRLGIVQIMIVSIGLSLTMKYLFAFIYGPNRLTLEADNSAWLVLGPIRLRQYDVLGALICVALILVVAFVLMRTRIGKAMRAVSDNKPLAAASGINVERVIRIVWIGSGALAAVAGALLGYYQTLAWDTGAQVLLLIFAAITLGGLGTAFGALIGSLIIGVVMDVSTMIVPANLKIAVPLAIMILILLFRPQGILGKRERLG